MKKGVLFLCPDTVMLIREREEKIMKKGHCGKTVSYTHLDVYKRQDCLQQGLQQESGHVRPCLKKCHDAGHYISRHDDRRNFGRKYRGKMCIRDRSIEKS